MKNKTKRDTGHFLWLLSIGDSIYTCSGTNDKLMAWNETRFIPAQQWLEKLLLLYSYALILIAIKPTTPAPNDGICPDTWVPYGNNCYKFDVRHDRASWFEAQYDCESVGADLASVHTKAENEFIRVYAQRAIGVTSVWLGLALNTGGKMVQQPVIFLSHLN